MWADSLASSTTLDKMMRLTVAATLIIWLWMVGTRIETPYPEILVDMYALPLTRVMLLVLVLAAASWCPTVGILAAMAYVCLGADVIFFTHGGQNLASV
jgi:hypothetical protein